MSTQLSRRDFVGQAMTVGALAGIGDYTFLSGLPRVTADEAKPDKNTVQLTPDMEPLVRLIEDTPREKLLEAVADKVKKGTSYQQLLAAVMLAGVRGIKPRPVGFKFHAVLVVNSAHLASLAAPDTDRARAVLMRTISARAATRSSRIRWRRSSLTVTVGGLGGGPGTASRGSGGGHARRASGVSGVAAASASARSRPRTSSIRSRSCSVSAGAAVAGPSTSRSGSDAAATAS